MNKVELLAPAGSVESFYGAIHAGADAVYLAGKSFGARAYADNFTTDELIACIRHAHLFGRRVYLTVNTLVKEREMEELVPFLTPFYEAGLDGVIVQDIGVLSVIREHFPELELHASTQMTITGSAGALFLKELGVSRVVPARELSLRELSHMKEETNLELECFIHGAMCYCYSGQCLFSSLLGGRSGNRGRCAQPCRLPYDTGKRVEQYPLSLKDLSTITILPSLLKAGIDSLKIEGRMKKPEYAAGVTAIYRKYLDLLDAEGEDAYQVKREDLDNLSHLYLRSERETGYYNRHNGKEMITIDSPAYSGSDEALLAAIRTKHLSERLKLPVTMYMTLLCGEEASLTILCGEHSTSVSGEIVPKATKQPLSEENVRKQLNKLGDTSFVAEELFITLDENAFYSLKGLNELRRSAVMALEKEIITAQGLSYERRTLAEERHTEDTATAFSFQREKGDHQASIQLSVRTVEQLRAACASSLCHEDAILCLDGDLFLSLSDEKLISLAEENSVLVSLPDVLRERDTSYLERFFSKYASLKEKLCGIRVASYDEIYSSREALGEELPLYGDHRLYAWNTAAAAFFGRYLEGICLPLELTQGEQRDLLAHIPSAFFSKLVYGYLPMMVTANCVAKTMTQCHMEQGSTVSTLTDRTGKKLPILQNCEHCYNVIYNTVPLSLHRELSKWAGRVMLRLDFTIEDEKQTRQVLSFYEGVLNGKEWNHPPFLEYTTGHEKHGVE